MLRRRRQSTAASQPAKLQAAYPTKKGVSGAVSASKGLTDGRYREAPGARRPYKVLDTPAVTRL
ncbi:hypothetical protein ACSS6W_007216 [Trichoderma asperelloides]